VIVGAGELADGVRGAATSESVEVLGLIDPQRLEVELERAEVGLVCQRSDVEEFNVPSKLMNLMAKCLPVLACVSRRSEVAGIVAASGGGWVAPIDEPEALAHALDAAVGDKAERERRGGQARAYALAQFHPDRFAKRFEDVLVSTVGLDTSVSKRDEPEVSASHPEPG
jgi:colanic acid biosynthesis glycosyl transferase WcaI